MAQGITTPVPGPVAQIAATRAVAVLGDAGGESLRRLMQLEVGKAFAAEVLSRLPGGEFVVGIAGTVARMALPQGAAIGDQLHLTLIGTSPRPQFLLDAPKEASAASLSPAARLIDSLMRQQRGDAIIAPAPLLPDAAAAADTPAPVLASAMRAALEHSGLFYESHVAQWAAGDRPMEALLREPQMQAAATATPGHGASAALPASMDAAASLPQPAAPDALTLAAMQLDTLEQRRVAWQGELFPGQPLHWEVRQNDEREAGAQPGAAEDARIWQSAVRLELPGLGAVQAQLQLRANRLQLQLQAADAGAAALMKHGGAALTLALEAAGIAVDQLSVRHESA
jgi:hypothetical protein